MAFTKLDSELFDEVSEFDLDINKIKKLVEKGANINAIHPEVKNTVLMEAVEMLEDDEANIITLLLELGADANIEVEELNALVLAIYDQKIEMIKALIQGGANPHAQLADGQTVLEVAEDFFEEMKEQDLDLSIIEQIIALMK